MKQEHRVCCSPIAFIRAFRSAIVGTGHLRYPMSAATCKRLESSRRQSHWYYPWLDPDIQLINKTNEAPCDHAHAQILGRLCNIPYTDHLERRLRCLDSWVLLSSLLALTSGTSHLVEGRGARTDMPDTTYRPADSRNGRP